MIFTWVDIIAIAILALGLIRGWRAGFIVMAGNITSLVVGLVVSAYAFSWLSNLPILANWHVAHPYLAILAFIVILLFITKILRLVVTLANTLWRIVAFIPLLGPLNSFLGAIIGLVESLVILLIAVYILQNFVVTMPMSAELASAIVDSMTFAYFSFLVNHLPLIIPPVRLFL